MPTFIYADGMEFTGLWGDAPQEGVAIIVHPSQGLIMGADIYYEHEGTVWWSNAAHAVLQMYQPGVSDTPYTDLKQFPVKFGRMVLEPEKWNGILDRAHKLRCRGC